MIEEASARCPSCGSMYPAGATFCPQCGHVLSTSSAAAAPAETPMQASTPAATPAPNQSPNVLLIQPHESEARESNWGPWVALILVLVLVAAGFAMWSAGYFGTTTAAPTTQPDTRVSIENSPQVSSGQNTPPARRLRMRIFRSSCSCAQANCKHR